jgi:VWFA-related protein
VLIVNKCLLLLLPVVIAAQTTPAPPEPVLRSTTRLIQLNVIVHDKHGQPVRDLKKEDFTVLDNGKPQAVSIFSMDSNAVLPQVAKLAPNVFTNQLHQRSAVPSSVTVILLDDFTTDSSDLLRKLSKYNGGILPEGVSASDNSFGPDSGGQFDGWMNGTGGVSGAEADFYTINRVEGTLHAIDFIANHLASLPGRKNLIWVSGGFPLQIGFESIEAMTDPSRQQRSFGPEVERTINALNEGNVAIYPVDSRGLVAPMQFSAANRRIDNTPKLSMGPIVEHQQTMSMLADRTGGHAYYNTNDLAKAIRDAVDDSALTYTIGFYPEGGAHDGKFHKLQVKTTVAGTNVRYRKGYFDTEEKPQDVKARRVELRDAVWSPIDASAMGLLVQVAPPDPAHPTDLNVYVRVDPAAIGLTANGNLQDGALDFLFIQKNEQGKQFNGSDDTVTLTLKPESAQKLRKEGLIYHKLVAKLPQATQLRVVVRDASSGTLGSVTVPFSQLKL